MADLEGGELTIIGADTHIEGKMRFQKGAKVNGKFDGEITGPGELRVANNAVCKANVEAGSVSVDGTIEGNIAAKDRVALNNGGRVKGDIVAAKMVMAEGASLYGQVAIGPDAAQQRSSIGGAPTSGGTPGGAPQPPKK
jgi:cytoskeletal protein CcmA (bactofilin family)